jgi:hypothetical protein
MAPKVLFVTPSSGPAGSLLRFSVQTNALELVAVKSQAQVFVDEVAARDERSIVMRARTSKGHHVALSVDIQD